VSLGGAREEGGEFLTAERNGVKLFFSPLLRVKTGHAHIQIVLKGLLFWHWLELEGAGAIPVYE